MSIYLGVIAGGFGGYIADSPALGWRFAFTIFGIVGMIYSVPLLLALREAPTPPRDVDTPTTAPEHLSPARALGMLLTHLNFILLVLYFTLPALAGWVVRDWMPAILKQQFHIGQGKAGIAATLYWQSAAIVGAIVGGALADRAARRTSRGRIFVSALGMTLIAPAIFGVGIASSLAIAITFLILFGLGYGFWDGNNMPILCQIVRKDLRATGYGVMNFVSISCGGLADWGFGHLRDRHVALGVIFGLFAAVAAMSVVIVLLIRPRETTQQT
jgi:MFS family permease